jgi:hypothetical protein
MNSSTTKAFREGFLRLPPAVQSLARKNYRLWRENPRHPSLHFKRVGVYWSARIGEDYRAMGRQQGGIMYWFWIGPHDEYDKLLKRN